MHIFIYEYFAYMHISVPGVCLVSMEARIERESLRTVGTEDVSHYVGAGKRTSVLWKRSQCS